MEQAPSSSSESVNANSTTSSATDLPPVSVSNPPQRTTDGAADPLSMVPNGHRVAGKQLETMQWRIKKYMRRYHRAKKRLAANQSMVEKLQHERETRQSLEAQLRSTENRLAFALERERNVGDQLKAAQWQLERRVKSLEVAERKRELEELRLDLAGTRAQRYTGLQTLGVVREQLRESAIQQLRESRERVSQQLQDLQANVQQLHEHLRLAQGNLQSSLSLHHKFVDVATMCATNIQAVEFAAHTKIPESPNST